MRKRLFAILMAMALFVANGSVNLFAATGGDQAPASATVEAAEASLNEIIVTVSNVKSNSVKLSWSYDPEDFEPSEVIVSYGSKEIKLEKASAKSYTVTGLKPATSYTFTVSAGGKSGSATKTTAKATIKNLKVLSGYKAVKLKWGKVDGAAKYVVKYSGKVRGKKISKSKEVTTNALKVKGFKEFDVINTNKSKGKKPIVDKDFSFTVTAYDSNGKVLADSSAKGFPVRTMYYKLTFKSSAVLTSHSGGSKKHKFAKGQVVYARGFDGGRFIFDYKCPDGKIRTYYTLKVRVKPAVWKSHINNKKEYTVEEAEFYVNARKIDSKTKNMIWVNTYTQREYVFKGKKGKWNIIKGPWLVSTGKASKPTATGATNINRRSPSEHGIPNWNVTRHFSLHGKHSTWKLGWPESGACVRNYNENAKWIYNNTPLRTRVFVF